MKRLPEVSANLPRLTKELPLSETEAIEVLRAHNCDVHHWWDYADYWKVEGPSIRVTPVGASALAAFALGVRVGSGVPRAAA